MPKVSDTSLKDFFDYTVSNYLPFAVYRLPKSNVVNVIAQSKPTLHSLNKNDDKKGFAFAPFINSKAKKDSIILADITTTDSKLPVLNFALTESKKIVDKIKPIKIVSSTKKEFTEYVGDIISNIQKGRFQKVVAARTIKLSKPKKFAAIEMFYALCKAYPTAFVSLTYTPQYGLWLGASPEVLLNDNGKQLTTYSLAGTKENNATNKTSSWGNKEKTEQEIVSKYISDSIFKLTNKKPDVKGPSTVAAGNLLHLRTTFSFAKSKNINWRSITKALHPTPAVAGIPKNKAVRFISENEKNGRGFYSGFLGPVNFNGNTNLFVNLRCMQILDKQLLLYTGCGITADSVPEKEWHETEIKSQTLIRVLKSLYP